MRLIVAHERSCGASPRVTTIGRTCPAVWAFRSSRAWPCFYSCGKFRGHSFIFNSDIDSPHGNLSGTPAEPWEHCRTLRLIVVHKRGYDASPRVTTTGYTCCLRLQVYLNSALLLGLWVILEAYIRRPGRSCFISSEDVRV
jgi:hypothetical protein